MRSPRSINSRKGGALLAVLWLSAALAAIAFSLATTVRGEIERASTLGDGMRAHYLALGAIERGLMWGRFGRGGAQAQPGPGAPAAVFSIQTPLMVFPFPTGAAVVEVIPETSKLDVNRATPEQLFALLAALGAHPAQALDIALAIVHWRSPGSGPLDNYYLAFGPSFRPRHASVQDVEELAQVRGMTPEIYHGNYVRDAQGRMVRLGAFKDCVSPWGSLNQFDVNTVEPAILVAAGMDPMAAQRLVAYRSGQPVVGDAQMAEISMIAGPAAAKLRRGGGNSIYTLRATARIRDAAGRLSDLRKTVAATVKFLPEGNKPPYHILRWDDTAVSEVSQWP